MITNDATTTADHGVNDMKQIQPTTPLFTAAELHSTPDNSKHTASVEEAFKKVSIAIHQGQKLEQSIASARKSLRNGTVDFDRIDAILREAHQNASSVQDFFVNACLESIPITRRLTLACSLKASQVFNTTELLEDIFLESDAFRIALGVSDQPYRFANIVNFTATSEHHALARC